MKFHYFQAYKIIVLSSVPHILIAPLNWGLGHASRSAVLIRELKKHPVHLLIGANGEAAHYLRQAFPEIEQVFLPFPRIHYYSRLPMVLGMFIQLPVLIGGILREQRLIRKIVRQHAIDIILSDNRFGLWHSSCFTVYLSHQIRIKMPGVLTFLEPIIFRIHNGIIRKYSQCWVPDYPDEPTFSGELSHFSPLPENIRFIGPLSHLEDIPYLTDQEKKSRVKLAFILSGPEPLRTRFEEQILHLLSEMKEKPPMVLVRGISGNKPSFPGEAPKNLQIFDCMDSGSLRNLMEDSDLIVCRSGYSSIMDLILLRKKAVLVPTPGQTEQEYLALRMKTLGAFYSIPQSGFTLKDLEKKSQSYHPEILFRNRSCSLNELCVTLLSEAKTTKHYTESQQVAGIDL